MLYFVAHPGTLYLCIMSRKLVKLLFYEGRREPTITITSTPSHLLSMRSATNEQVHYDVTNTDGAAAYIAGVYDFNNNSKVELIRKDDKQVIARWDYRALRTDSSSLSINNVKSILKSLQVRGEKK